MARGRMIASDIFNDEFFCELTQTERLLWIGIIVLCADDQGRLQDKPNYINSMIFTDDNLPPEIIESGLKKFTDTKKIYRYTADGKNMIQIIKWWTYQTPTWAMPSKYPSPIGWIDRIKAHVAGSVKSYTVNWDDKGGWRNNINPIQNDVTNIVTNQVTKGINELKRNEMKLTENNGIEDNTPPLLHPNLSDYEFQNADNINIDDIFLQVTGFLPSKEKDNIRKTIMLIADRENIPINPKNKPKVADILRPYFLEMCRRKNKNGQPYSRNGLFWLLEWAAIGEIPPIFEAKTKTETIADNNAKILQDAIDKYEAENG